MIRAAIQRVEYEILDGATDILLFVRTPEDERKKIRIERPLLPYFYTTKEPYAYGPIENVEKTDLTAIYSPDSTVWKVETGTPPQVGKVRRTFRPHFEADILFQNRFLIDTGLKYGIEYDEETGSFMPIDIDVVPKRMYLDIETPSQKAKDSIKKAPGKIAIIGTNILPDKKKKFFVLKNPKLTDKENVEIFEKEEDLVRSFIDYVREVDPDQLIGKYVTGFDLPYLKYRSQRIGVDFDRISPMNSTRKRKNDFLVYGRDVLDWQPFYEIMKDTELESPRLHDILEDELGWDPVEIRDFEKCWENDPDRLLKRNRHDVTGPPEIDRRKSIPKFFNELRKLVGCRYEQTRFAGTLADLYCLREIHKSEYVAPSRDTFGKEGSFGGAAVLEPRQGRWENVRILDISSAYPSSILTFNISPETFVEEGRKTDAPTIAIQDDVHDIKFRTDERGIMPRLLENLLEEREKKKRMMERAEGERKETLWAQQYALKILANSFYGIMGDSRKRYFNYQLAESITKMVKELIEYEKKRMEEEGGTVVLGDTDSTGVISDMDTDELVSLSNRIADEFMREKRGVDEHYISLDLDKEYDALIVREKKLYAGRRKSTGKIEKKGIASRRTDTSPIAREIQTRMLEQMLDGEDKSRVARKIRASVKRVERGEVPFRRLGVPTKFRKDPKEYDPSDVRSKLWRRSRDYLDLVIEKGDKVRRVICEGVGMIAGHTEKDLGDLQIDYREMIDTYIRPKLEPFMDLYDLSWDTEVEGQQTLSSLA